MKALEIIFLKKIFGWKIFREEIFYDIYEDNNYLIVCNLDIKKSLNTFPKIYFFNQAFPYIFNLDYNNVFMEYNDKIYFLIIFKQAINTIWKVGKIFMKKYPFIFGYDQRSISFVNLNKFGNKKEEESKNDKNNNKY